MTKSLFWPLFALLIILTGAAKGTTLENNPPSFQGANRPFTLLSPFDPAPSAPIYTLSGGVTMLKRFVGKVVLLNLWATWCPACVFELPTLGNLQARTLIDYYIRRISP
jgi:thiol-disulfide isomerase/thioredoxin